VSDVPPPTPATRILILLGNPVAHSLSPAFQNAAIRALGLDAVYAALPCDMESVRPLIRAFCRAGGGGNVTVPHKAPAAECLERATPAVRRTGACNTFWGEDGVICGDNTDVDGFRYAIRDLLPDPAGSTAFIVGAGGAAAAAACALLDAGAGAITLINRSPDRARTLAARLDPDGRVLRVVTSRHDVAGQDIDLVVNATSLGLAPGGPLPFDLATLGRVGAALDLVYAASGETSWVAHARALGIPAADGTAMLLGQGAAAFSRWFRTDPPLDAMRDALERATRPA
jgi:shikimate dehydrogenase